MAHLIREAGPQEPIYGIHHANIVKRLTRQNWRTKAVARFDSKGWIYLWVIRRRYRHPAGGISATYTVKAYTDPQARPGRAFERGFTYLRDALAYVNGEDEGLLAKRTWPADTELTYPPEREAPYYVGFGRPVKISPR